MAGLRTSGLQAQGSFRRTRLQRMDPSVSFIYQALVFGEQKSPSSLQPRWAAPL